MPKPLHSVHIVVVSYKDRTEYWAAATVRSEACAAIRKHIPTGATAKLVNRFLSQQQIINLNLPPQGIRKLEDVSFPQPEARRPHQRKRPPTETASRA